MDLQKMCVCLHLYTQFHFDFVQQMKSVSSKRPFGEWISFMAVCIFAAIELCAGDFHVRIQAISTPIFRTIDSYHHLKILNIQILSKVCAFSFEKEEKQR